MFDLQNLFTRRPAFKAVPVSMPLDCDMTMIAHGDAGHGHDFKEVPWEERLGKRCIDIDKDNGRALEFPMLTMRTLYKCSCGAKGFISKRCLI